MLSGGFLPHSTLVSALVKLALGMAHGREARRVSSLFFYSRVVTYSMFGVTLRFYIYRLINNSFAAILDAPS